MAEWAKHLYVGTSAKSIQKKLMSCVDEGTFYPNAFLITEASNPVEQLDILPASMYLKEKKRERIPKIYGLALGREEALELILQITRATYAQTGGADLLKFLKEREQREEGT